MNSESLKTDIDAMWHEHATGFLKSAQRIDVDSILCEAKEKAEADIDSHMALQMLIYKESIHFLMQLDRMVTIGPNTIGNQINVAFALLLSRCISLVVGIYRLITSGLEDAARPVARSLLETLDLAIVSLTDDEFTLNYLGENEDYDDNKFWKEHVAYGKIYNKIRKTIELTGLPKEEAESYINSRRELKSILSGSVHVSVSSSFRSFCTPSLGNRNLLARAPEGHVSVHSPGFIAMVIKEIYRFGTIFIKLMIAPSPLDVFENIEKDSKVSLTAAFLVFQDLVIKYDDQLPPPFESLWNP